MLYILCTPVLTIFLGLVSRLKVSKGKGCISKLSGEFFPQGINITKCPKHFIVLLAFEKFSLNPIWESVFLLWWIFLIFDWAGPFSPQWRDILMQINFITMWAVLKFYYQFEFQGAKDNEGKQKMLVSCLFINWSIFKRKILRG